jgi:hypothetical protein
MSVSLVVRDLDEVIVARSPGLYRSARYGDMLPRVPAALVIYLVSTSCADAE